jgi:hypothetical protein
LGIIADAADVDAPKPYRLGGQQDVLGHEGNIDHRGETMLGPALQGPSAGVPAGRVHPSQVRTEDPDLPESDFFSPLTD